MLRGRLGKEIAMAQAAHRVAGYSWGVGARSAALSGVGEARDCGLAILGVGAAHRGGIRVKQSQFVSFSAGNGGFGAKTKPIGVAGKAAISDPFDYAQDGGAVSNRHSVPITQYPIANTHSPSRSGSARCHQLCKANPILAGRRGR
jgi:hypothetical protein